MKKCIVIGGGLAGLSAAVFLADSGLSVEVIEASPKLGGRTYSFKDKITSDIIDNGQHILMGCYNETLDFIRLIKSENNFIFQKQLKVNFLKEDFKLFPLKSNNSFYPFNLLSALLNYKAISLGNRLRLLKFFAKLLFYSGDSLSRMTVHEWLLLENQTEEIVKSFWEILAVGALNTNINKASAKIFSDILKKMFLKGSRASNIILPKYGLSESFCNNSKKFIEERNGTISLLESVDEIVISGEKIISLKTNKREITGIDYVVSAVPYFILKNIPGINGIILNEINFRYSTIISIHIWLKENNLEEDFYGLINSPVHWIFNHRSHLSLVISDANDLAPVPNEELFTTAALQLEKYLGISKDKIISHKIIKEKRATFIPSNDILNERPSAQTCLKNFFLAGDWVDTGLPATIESAVKSGRAVSELINK
jgi:hydroxysqualene dehydroxylase